MDRRQANVPFFGQRRVEERRHRYYDRRRHHGITRILFMGFGRIMARLFA